MFALSQLTSALGLRVTGMVRVVMNNDSPPSATRATEKLGVCRSVTSIAATVSTALFGLGQPPKPGRFSSRLALLSARFSFSVLPGFLAFDFFGDLSPMRPS